MVLFVVRMRVNCLVLYLHIVTVVVSMTTELTGCHCFIRELLLICIKSRSASCSCYRPQRSCGQGNVFTGVCLSTGGEGVCLSVCWDAIPPLDGGTPQVETPPDGEHPPGWRTPPDGEPPPPGKQTPAYGLRAAGTHPTGMHSCFHNCFHHATDHDASSGGSWISQRVVPTPKWDAKMLFG